MDIVLVYKIVKREIIPPNSTDVHIDAYGVEGAIYKLMSALSIPSFQIYITGAYIDKYGDELASDFVYINLKHLPIYKSLANYIQNIDDPNSETLIPVKRIFAERVGAGSGSAVGAHIPKTKPITGFLQNLNNLNTQAARRAKEREEEEQKKYDFIPEINYG